MQVRMQVPSLHNNENVTAAPFSFANIMIFEWILDCYCEQQNVLSLQELSFQQRFKSSGIGPDEIFISLSVVRISLTVEIVILGTF